MSNAAECRIAHLLKSLFSLPSIRWSSFLDNMTEELEESKVGTTIYEDYKFVTRDELEQLNMTDMIGTNLLRPYMHGFFVDIRLYNKVRPRGKFFKILDMCRNDDYVLCVVALDSTVFFSEFVHHHHHHRLFRNGNPGQGSGRSVRVRELREGQDQEEDRGEAR